MPVDQGYREARQAVEHALSLDADLAEAHSALAWIKRSYDWDWTGAEAELQRALALAPGDSTVLRGAALIDYSLGRVEEALRLGRQAVAADPLNAAG